MDGDPYEKPENMTVKEKIKVLSGGRSFSSSVEASKQASKFGPLHEKEPRHLRETEIRVT